MASGPHQCLSALICSIGALNPRRSCGALTEAIRSRYAALAEESGGGRTADHASMEREGAVFYMLATGCQWKALPKDLPPNSTARSNFMLWDWGGTLERIYDSLYVAVRESAGKDASPTTAIIYCQSRQGRSKRSASIDPQELDAGKKVKWRKAPYPRR